ncbi:tyrosine-type recombinase/integrase [Patescibacteria group bacterium]|nr:tyrosine-type recombinase/integrase [Patescibacteria group bacterium]
MVNEIEQLNLNEINALLKNTYNLRDRAIIILFLNTGLFLAELLGLKINSIDWDKKLLKLSGSRARETPLNEQAYEALAKWSKERPDVRCSFFFITTKGKVKKLSGRAIDKLIRKYAKQAGINKRVNAQILRNTFAIRLFSEEISLDKAKTILGITDPQSIDKYIQAAKKPLQKPEIPQPEVVEHVDTRSKLSKLLSKIFPTKPKQAKPLTEIKGPIIPSPSEVIFGRERMIEEIKSSVSKSEDVLLIGPLGIGKTHVLRHIPKLMGPNTLYVASPSPIKNMLTQICDRLDPEWRKHIKARATTKEITDFIIKTKGGEPPLIIIDNLNNLKIPDVDTFLSILENFTIISSTEELKPRLKQIWWKFKQIEVKELTEASAKELIRYLTQNLPISDYELLVTRVLHLSNRLPLAIVDMIHQISHRPVVTSDVIREVYHEAGVKYRDWTAVIVILWGVAIIFRFIALGTHSFEAYILAGFGTAFMMIMRFFAFRMR